MGPYCHTHNYSPLPIHYVDRDHFEKKTMLTGPDGGAAASAPRRRTMARPWTGMNRSQGTCGSMAVGEGEYKGSLVLVRGRLPSPKKNRMSGGVKGWTDQDFRV